MQNYLDDLCDCFNQNKLSPNSSKCETMSFGSTHQNTLTIYNEPSSQKTCSKYLGGFTDSKLTNRGDINHVVKTFNNFCGLLYRVRDIYPINVYCRFTTHMLGLYFAMAYQFMALQRVRILKKLKWCTGELSERFFINRNFDIL